MILFSVQQSFTAEAGSGIPILMLDSYGARQVALGDTFTGIADDINSISVNPAGLSSLQAFEISSMYMKYLEDLSFGYLALGMPLPSNAGYVGASLSLFSVPDFDGYDLAGNKSADSSSSGDMGFSVAYANNPFKLLNIDANLNLGFSVKYIQSKLAGSSISALGFDIGGLYRLNIPNLGSKEAKENLGIGVSIQNLGSSIKYKAEETLLPQNLRFGLGYRGFNSENHSVLVGFDVNMPNDSDSIMSAGLEYTFMQIISARAGYKFSGTDIGGLSFGIGAGYNLSGKRISLDYALVPVEEFNTVHTFSLGIRF